MGYARSSFRDLESSLSFSSSKQYNSLFVTYELSTKIYSIKDISEAVYSMGDLERTLKIEFDDITRKTKPF